ncbi:unnamed protein product, partial [Iphiclides podalirius]
MIASGRVPFEAYSGVTRVGPVEGDGCTSSYLCDAPSSHDGGAISQWRADLSAAATAVRTRKPLAYLPLRS